MFFVECDERISRAIDGSVQHHFVVWVIQLRVPHEIEFHMIEAKR